MAPCRGRHRRAQLTAFQPAAAVGKPTAPRQHTPFYALLSYTTIPVPLTPTHCVPGAGAALPGAFQCTFEAGAPSSKAPINARRPLRAVETAPAHCVSRARRSRAPIKARRRSFDWRTVKEATAHCVSGAAVGAPFSGAYQCTPGAVAPFGAPITAHRPLARR